MESVAKVLIGLGIAAAALISCYVPGEEVPPFENCPSFPKSWEFTKFGEVGSLNFLLLDDMKNPIVVKTYDEDDTTYLEIAWLKDDEIESSATELEYEAKHLWATYGDGEVHIALSTAEDESSPITYCSTDKDSWDCEDTGYEGEPRIFIDSDSKPSILALSANRLRYLAKYKDEWRCKGDLNFSGPASGWAFSAEGDSPVAALANKDCEILWLEFDGKWNKQNTSQTLCSPSFAGVEFYGAPLIIGRTNDEDPSRGYAFKQATEDWVKISLGDTIEQLFVSYPFGCDRAYAIYRRNHNLRRRTVEIEPYTLDKGEERGIELPDKYELREIMNIAQDSKRRPHMLLLVKLKKDNSRLLLYAKPE